jgi:hypothetical protein
MRQGIDNYILSYILLRIRAGLDFLINSRRAARNLGPLAPRIREQWPPMADLLQSYALRVRAGEGIGWTVADTVGLTEGMLDLKREALDLTLGRRTTSAAFLAGLERAKTAGIDDWFSPKKTSPTETEFRKASPVSFTDLAADILDSILKILGVDDRFHAIKEFIAVIKAAYKMNRDVFR